MSNWRELKGFGETNRCCDTNQLNGHLISEKLTVTFKTMAVFLRGIHGLLDRFELA